MYNSRPNGVGKFKGGNYLPKNRDKFYKLNKEGGVYYRSSYEQKVLIFLDLNEDITLVAVEHLAIPYVLKKVDKYNSLISESSHQYFVDFYYELKMQDGSTKRVALEVKPKQQTVPPSFKETSKMSKKQLESYKWAIDEWNKNMSKWTYAIEYCKQKGIFFKIITEDEIKRLFIKI